MTETLEDMIEYDLQDRGIKDPRVLEAFRKIDRKYFVPQIDRARAYDDRALSLTHGQTLSQPYIVALMTQSLSLKGTERVLEVGTGSGYQTAILSALAKEVYSVERIEYLATTAEDRLLDLKISNVRYHVGDGSKGWPENAPYDRIIVTAACPRIPQSLIDQLAEGGVIVAPVGTPACQHLVIGTKSQGRVDQRKGISCIFVKLIGNEGYTSQGSEGAEPDPR